MDKGIRKVRARIKRRKREQIGVDRRDLHERNDLPLMFSDEEKHGFQLPMYDRTKPETMKMEKRPKSQGSSQRILLSFVLFIGFVVLFKTSIVPFQNVKDIAHSALTDEFPFAKVHHWYVETLGVPLAFTPQLPSEQSDTVSTSTFPIHGEVMETFATNGTGIMISPGEESKVRAWKQGIVIFSGRLHETDKTVIVQHPDGSKTTYGLLSDVDVHLYKFVQADEVIGSFNPSVASDVAYFAIEKDKQFIDPTKVIQVDDFR